MLTATGVGTTVEDGKQKIDIDGETSLLERPLRADFALLHAFLADYEGNLTYALTARNFNPIIALSGKTVIATAEHIVGIPRLVANYVPEGVQVFFQS